jgi:hypothetical protein
VSVADSIFYQNFKHKTLLNMTNKKFLPLILLALAAAIFPACDKDTPSGPDILPGVGLKEVKIGDEAKKAFDAYGPTTTGYVEANGQFIHFLDYATLGIKILLEPTSSAAFDDKTKIKSFALDAPYSGKTAENIGLGSTKTEVRAAYGQPNLSDATTDTYTTLGIAFTYDAAEKTEGIGVSKF